MTAPADLLTALLVCHWRGGIDLERAAKMVGIRKEEFAELAALRRCLLVVERAAWTYFMAQFNYAFPECDRRAVMRPVFNAHSHVMRTYTDSELLSAPKRDRESNASA